MRRKHQHIPAPIDLLERRVVLSHMAPGAPVGGGLPSYRIAMIRERQSLTDQINQEFDSFRGDYDQARATYFASIQNQTAPSTATTYAFVAYTTQRVSLLAQQTLSILFEWRRSPAQAHALKRLVGTKIMGSRAQMPAGSLAQALLDTVPQPGTTSPTSSLYSLGQDYAIESAQVAILNGVENP